jgi:hypothetical protein
MFLYSKYMFCGPRMQVVLYAALDVTPVTGDTCFYTQNICFVGRVCDLSYTRPLFLYSKYMFCGPRM